MWYLSGPGVCYAESGDGIVWTKPRLDIVSVDGRAVEDTRDLIDTISALPPETEVELGLIRNGKTMTLTVTLEERQLEGEQAEPVEGPSGEGDEVERVGHGNGERGVRAAHGQRVVMPRDVLRDGQHHVRVEGERRGDVEHRDTQLLRERVYDLGLRCQRQRDEHLTELPSRGALTLEGLLEAVGVYDARVDEKLTEPLALIGELVPDRVDVSLSLGVHRPLQERLP